MLTAQGVKKPKHAQKSNFDGWVYTAIKWFTGNITCMHCNASVNTNKL